MGERLSTRAVGLRGSDSTLPGAVLKAGLMPMRSLQLSQNEMKLVAALSSSDEVVERLTWHKCGLVMLPVPFLRRIAVFAVFLGRRRVTCEQPSSI